MSIKAKRKKALPAKAQTERERFTVFEVCRDEIRRMAKEGIFDGNAERWHPAARLARLSEDPACSLSLRFLCLKELLPYVSMPKAAEVRALAGDNAGTTGCCSRMAGWPSPANGPQRVPPSESRVGPSTGFL